METKKLEVITSNPANWKRVLNGYELESGVVLNDALVGEALPYYKVPASTMAIDRMFEMTIVKDCLSKVTNQVQVVFSEGEVVTVKNPKAAIVQEDVFKAGVERAGAKVGMKPFFREAGFAFSAEFDFPEAKTDNMLGDLYRRRMRITRNPEGGVTTSSEFVRLVCSNGCVVSDRSYRHESYDGVNEERIEGIFALMSGLSLDAFLTDKFTRGGEFFPASVANFFDMKKLLAKVTTKEHADECYPEAPIREHYLKGGVEIDKINRNLLHALPSGLSYYDCFNILTHGIKFAEQLTLNDKVAVGNFVSASKIDQIKKTTLHVSGEPVYPKGLVARLKGDRV